MTQKITVTLWQEVGTLFEESGYYGDDQAGRAFSRRFTHTKLPGRLFTIAVYPVQGDFADPDSVIRLEQQTEMMVCTDIDDPGGTEKWSGYEYGDLPEAYSGIYTTEALAEAAARNLVTTFDPDRFIGWDGRPDELVCEYSALHQHEGQTATAILDCGPVGKIPACEKCAVFYAQQRS